MPEIDRTATVPAGAGLTVLSTRPGRLRGVVVTAAGTGAGPAQFFDNASAAAGTVIGAVPGTVALGTSARFDMPAAVGIVCQNAANGPAMTISLS